MKISDSIGWQLCEFQQADTALGATKGVPHQKEVEIIRVDQTLHLHALPFVIIVENRLALAIFGKFLRLNNCRQRFVNAFSLTAPKFFAVSSVDRLQRFGLAS